MSNVNKIKELIKEVVEDDFLLKHNELVAEIDAKKIMLMQETVRKHNNHGKEVDPETNQSDIEHFNATMATEDLAINLYPGDKGVDVIGDEDLGEFPTVDIPLDKLVANEPLLSKTEKEEDMKVIRSLIDAFKAGQDVTPILVRKIKGDKYQILDGHHRYIAAKASQQPSIKSIIIPPSAITLVDDNGEPLMEDIADDTVRNNPVYDAIKDATDAVTISEPLEIEEVLKKNLTGVPGIYIWYFKEDSPENKNTPTPDGGDIDQDKYNSRLAAYVGMSTNLATRLTKAHLTQVFNQADMFQYRPADYIGGYHMGSDLGYKMFSYLLNTNSKLIDKKFIKWVDANNNELLLKAYNTFIDTLENREGDTNNSKVRSALTTIKNFVEQNRDLSALDIIKTSFTHSHDEESVSQFIHLLVDEITKEYKKRDRDFDPKLKVYKWIKDNFRIKLVTFKRNAFDRFGASREERTKVMSQAIKYVEGLLIDKMTQFDLKGTERQEVINFNKERNNVNLPNLTGQQVAVQEPTRQREPRAERPVREPRQAGYQIYKVDFPDGSFDYTFRDSRVSPNAALRNIQSAGNGRTRWSTAVAATPVDNGRFDSKDQAKSMQADLKRQNR